jgi:hypothetical protein
VQPIVDAAELEQAPSAAAQPVIMRAGYQAPPAGLQAPPLPSAALLAAESGPSGRDIESYLRRAGVNLAAGIEKVRKVSTATFSAFRWDTGVVYGAAEQQVMSDRNDFRQANDDYLEKTESRCSGAFDTSFDLSKMSGDATYAVADVACVMPDGQGAGAAIVFFYRDGLFSAVAHEGEIAQFEQAMQTRDLLARLLSNVI